MSSKCQQSGSKVQEELCKLMSSRFEGVNLMEITPFIAAMRMIKIEYGEDKSEVYKMLIAVLHDYNPFLGNAQYQKTVKYVKILLAQQPELCDYMVSIIPRPEDVQKKEKTESKGLNVPFSNANELLRHSLHIIGSKKRGFDLNLKEKPKRQDMNADDPKMKIFKFYNLSVSNEAGGKGSTSQVKQKYTIRASTPPSTNAQSVVIKTEPVDTSDSDGTKSHGQRSHETEENIKMTVHEMIREKLQSRQKQSLQQMKTKSFDVSVQRGETTTTFDSSRNRPIILRKPDLQVHHKTKSLPTAEIESQKNGAGSQSFPYTQQVVLSDGRKQNFVFNAKGKERDEKISPPKTVMVPLSASGFLHLNSDQTNPLVCLQQMVSEANISSPLPSSNTANVVVVHSKKSADAHECNVDVVNIDENPQLQKPATGDRKQSLPSAEFANKHRKARKNTSEPIDLTTDKDEGVKKKRKRSNNEIPRNDLENNQP